jgi:hypothetical protein
MHWNECETVGKIKNQARAEGFLLSLCIPVKVLHDTYGFGKIRLNRFLEPCMEIVDAMQKGEVNLQEIIQDSEKLAKVHFIMDNLGQRKPL